MVKANVSLGDYDIADVAHMEVADLGKDGTDKMLLFDDTHTPYELSFTK